MHETGTSFARFSPSAFNFLRASSYLDSPCVQFLFYVQGERRGGVFFQASPSHEAGEGGAERSDRRGACWTSSDTRTRNLSLMVSPIAQVCFVARWLLVRWPLLVLVLGLLIAVFLPLSIFDGRCFVHTHRLINKIVLQATPYLSIYKGFQNNK